MTPGGFMLTHACLCPQPTNYDMLLFRTLNRELKMPGHNSDGLAALIRDELV